MSPTKKLTKKFLIIFVPVTCAVILISWLVYYFHHIKTQEEIILAQESNMIQMQSKFVEKTLKAIISDLNVIASDLVLRTNEVLGDQNRDNHQIMNQLISFSRYKGVYDQIRFLDTRGMERIRIDLREKTPVMVPEAKLQFKGNRYYFKDTIKLGKEEIFMSPLDLNIERGKIERPLKPMIRFGKVIFDHGGRKKGVFILNFLAEKLIHDLENLSLRSPGHLIIISANGYYLKGLRPEDEWGFMFEDRNDKNIQNDYPEIWQNFLDTDHGQIVNAKGIFTFNKFYPLKSGITGIKSSSGSETPYEKSVNELEPKDYFWVITSHIYPQNTLKNNDNFLLAMILADTFFLILLGVVMWKLVVAQEKKRVAEKKLKQNNLALEEMVKKRTRELSETNKTLEAKIEELRMMQKEKQKTEFRLIQAQKMEAIGTLAGGIAHDFNNILTPILGYAQLIAFDLPENSPIQRDVKEIISGSHRAKELVGQILSFSRQSEKQSLPIRLQPLIKEAVKLLKATIPTSIEIRNEINPKCRRVIADPVQIHQIIMNLCTNAYHAMKKKNCGVLCVKLDEIEIGDQDYNKQSGLVPGDYIKLEIGDTGEGIDPKIQTKIFEPYFTTKKKGEGTGLGLAVAHSIIKELKGDIYVYSELRVGTTFHILLPITPAFRD